MPNPSCFIPVEEIEQEDWNATYLLVHLYDAIDMC